MMLVNCAIIRRVTLHHWALKAAKRRRRLATRMIELQPTDAYYLISPEGVDNQISVILSGSTQMCHCSTWATTNDVIQGGILHF